MNKKLLCATSLLIALSSPAFAANNDSTTTSLGEAATPSTSTRTIPIKADTNWVEVKNGEVVNFAVNNRTFAWHFNGSDTLSEIDLNKIAPNGMVNHPVRVYIERPAAD